MSGGLAALLDDIAALAKLAAASVDDVGAAAGRASAKAAGVVIDDTAVTPRYVHGFTAEREIPIIKRIAFGSLRNKLVFILPAIMLLSEFLDWAVSPLLMLGGAYLCFEGAEKIWERVAGHDGAAHAPAAVEGGAHEETMVKGAIRTDFILSAEIMVIALREVTDQAFVSRLLILIVVAVAITLLVYGAVGLIVKMDDIGLSLAERPSPTSQRIGYLMVKSVPKIMAVLSLVGIVAMVWVGGHILLVGADEVGWHAPYDLVHHAEDAVNDVAAVGGVLGWLVNTALSFVVGLIVGAILVAVMHLVQRRGGGHGRAGEAGDHPQPPAAGATMDAAVTPEVATRAPQTSPVSKPPTDGPPAQPGREVAAPASSSEPGRGGAAARPTLPPTAAAIDVMDGADGKSPAPG